MGINEIFRLDQSYESIMRLVAQWSALPLALIIAGFFFASSAVAWGWANWSMKPRKQVIVTIFGMEAIIGLAVTLVFGAVFVIHSFGLMPRSTISLCELNSIRMNLVISALDNYKLAHNSFPTGTDWPQVLKVEGIWPAKELPKGEILDAGGVPFRLETDGFSAALRSAGPDSDFDSRDDFLCDRRVDPTTSQIALAWTCIPESLVLKSQGCSW